MGWGLDIFPKFAVKYPCPRANHSIQMKPNFPTPCGTLCCQISQSWTQELHNKDISKLRLWNLYLYYIAASPKIQLQLYVLTIIRVTLGRIQKPFGESPYFVSLNIPFLVKGKLTVIVANEPYTDQLYLQKSTWLLFTSIYFDTTVS